MQATPEIGVLEAPAASVQEEHRIKRPLQTTLNVNWNNPANGVEVLGWEANLLHAKCQRYGRRRNRWRTSLTFSIEPLPDGAIVVRLKELILSNKRSLPQTRHHFTRAGPSAISNWVDQSLGISPAGQGGEITDQSAWGASDETNQALG